MASFARVLAVAALAATGPAVAASPLQVASTVLVEQRRAAADGSVRVALAPAKRIVPGDRVVFALDYRNIGKQALADVVFDNPVPAGVAYRAAAPGSPEPLLSVDGRTFGALGTLRIAGRAATLADVSHVRWRLTSPVAAGGTGRLAFQAVLK